MNQTHDTHHDLLVVLGPTATGKTKLAVQLANRLDGEIISADSRQVYRGMDIGTGKDLKEYDINGEKIPYHLIDIIEPIEEYNVFQFQKDFNKAFTKIQDQQKLPILCGGTGFYIKATLMNFHLPAVEPDKELRQELEDWTFEDLIQEFESIALKTLKNHPIDTKRRVIRAIEIAMNSEKEVGNTMYHNLQSKIQNPIVFGIEYPRDMIRKQITERLFDRLDQGMINEVEKLLDNGITHKRLESFGLEYRFISLHLRGQLTQTEMIEKLNTAIHQFAKRQMTFFRNIEKNGISIHWVPKGNVSKAMDILKRR